ncbi:MAG: hypothetical protein ACLTK1_00470 [Veillonella parvula]
MTNTVEIMSVELVIAADPSIKIVQSIGSVLHGVLMEVVVQSMQVSYMNLAYVLIANIFILDKDKKQYIWRLSAVTADAVNRIVRPMLEICEKIFLKQKRGHIYIKSRTILEEICYEALINKFWSSDSLYTQAKLHCMSTTSFKVDQQYTIFPEAFLYLSVFVTSMESI